MIKDKELPLLVSLTRVQILPLALCMVVLVQHQDVEMVMFPLCS